MEEKMPQRESIWTGTIPCQRTLLNDPFPSVFSSPSPLEAQGKRSQPTHVGSCLPGLKGLVSDILPARSSHTDRTTEFKNAAAATTIKNAKTENSVQASRKAGMHIYSSLCKLDTMEPFGAEIGLALSSIVECLVQTADLSPTMCLLGLRGIRAQHQPSMGHNLLRGDSSGTKQEVSGFTACGRWGSWDWWTDSRSHPAPHLMTKGGEVAWAQLDIFRAARKVALPCPLLESRNCRYSSAGTSRQKTDDQGLIDSHNW